jgi:hypothetical protein
MKRIFTVLNKADFFLLTSPFFYLKPMNICFTRGNHAGKWIIEPPFRSLPYVETAAHTGQLL